MTTTANRTLTMFYVSWEWPDGKKDGRASVPVVKPREIAFRPRRSVWDCLPLDTFEDIDAAAREGWYPTPEAALEAELRGEQEDMATAKRRIAALTAELPGREEESHCLGCGASAHSAEGDDGRCYHCEATFSDARPKKSARRARKGRGKS